MILMNNLKLTNPYSFKRDPFKYLSYRHQIRKWKKERAQDITVSQGKAYPCPNWG